MVTQTNGNGCLIKAYRPDCYIVSKDGARLGMFKTLDSAVEFATYYNGTPKHISEM